MQVEQYHVDFRGRYTGETDGLKEANDRGGGIASLYVFSLTSPEGVPAVRACFQQVVLTGL